MNTTSPTSTAPSHPESVLDQAVRAPTLLLEASIADKPHYTRPTGLILTQAQLVSLKKYEMAGLALPTELKDVIAHLGYEEGGGHGLEASDFQNSFKIINSHAGRWRPLQQKLRSVSSELKLFASKMVIQGQSMEKLITEIRANVFLDAHDIETVADLERVTLDLGDRYPGIDLDDQDRASVRRILTKIFNEIKKKNQLTAELKEELDEFGLDLKYKVLPEIKRKILAIDRNPLKSDLDQLKAKIEQRAKIIEEKNQEYKNTVKQSISSATNFNVVGLGMAIYLGVEAESVRNERNALIAKQAADIAQLGSSDRILASLRTLQLELQDLDIVVIDADTATENLITVWNAISLYIEHSLEATEDITDGLKLKWFMADFNLIVEPWKSVESDADRLLDVFRQADNELKRIKGQ